MAARQWTEAQKARQADLIRTWKPWEQSTVPVTQTGKEASSKNAFNCALREVMRELTRSNRALLAYLNGAAKTTPNFDRVAIDKLIDDVEAAMTPTTSKTTAQNEVPVTPTTCSRAAPREPLIN